MNHATTDTARTRLSGAQAAMLLRIGEGEAAGEAGAADVAAGPAGEGASAPDAPPMPDHGRTRGLITLAMLGVLGFSVALPEESGQVMPIGGGASGSVNAPTEASARVAGGAGGRSLQSQETTMFAKIKSVAAAGAMGAAMIAGEAGAQAPGTLLSVGDQANLASGEFVRIHASPYRNAIGLDPSGGLHAWGANTGAGNPPVGTGFRRAAVGYAFGIAIREDGTLVHWGDDSRSQSNIPTGQFMDVTCGDWDAVGLRTDGSLVQWGANSTGMTPPSGSDFTMLTSGNWHHLAIKGSGAVAAWGYNDTGACNVPGSLVAKRIAAGWQFSFALRTDGSITWWGTDYDQSMVGIPTDGGYVDIAFNIHQSKGGGLALRADGRVVRWPQPMASSDVFARAITTGYAIQDADCNADGSGDFSQILGGQLADLNANSIPDICEVPTCRDADLFRDDKINGADLGILLSQWGPANANANAVSDINHDGVVDGSDLGILLAFWGPCSG